MPKRKECGLCEKVSFSYKCKRKEKDPVTGEEQEVVHTLTTTRFPLFRTDRQLARHILKEHPKANKKVIDAANATLEKCRRVVKAARRASHVKGVPYVR